jgi:hypothetical protein
MQNREELRKKATIPVGVEKRQVAKGEEYYFQRGGGISFSDQNINP